MADHARRDVAARRVTAAIEAWHLLSSSHLPALTPSETARWADALTRANVDDALDAIHGPAWRGADAAITDLYRDRMGRALAAARAVPAVRVVVLLDVDGTVNAPYCETVWGGPVGRGRAVADGVPHLFAWAPGVAARLAALHESGRVSLRWCTTWVDHEPRQLSAMFGLPVLPSAFPVDKARPYRADWKDQYRAEKVAAALAVVRAGDALVWLDDDAIPADGPARVELDAATALLISPDWSIGLTPGDLARVEAYAKLTNP